MRLPAQGAASPEALAVLLVLHAACAHDFRTVEALLRKGGSCGFTQRSLHAVAWMLTLLEPCDAALITAACWPVGVCF